MKLGPEVWGNDPLPTDKRDTRVTYVASHVEAPDAVADLLGLGRTAHSAVALHAVGRHAGARHAVDSDEFGFARYDKDNQAENPHEFFWP
jgi:hypothetical protein